jgi:hypothetical protein
VFGHRQVVIGAGSVYPRKNRKQILAENACQKITILNLVQ